MHLLAAHVKVLHSLLHLRIFGACRCITTALFSVAVISARVVESDPSSHPMISVLCLLLRSSHARLPTQCARFRCHLQDPAGSFLKSILLLSTNLRHCNWRGCQLARSCLHFGNLPVVLRGRSSCHFKMNSSSSAMFFLARLSRSFLSLNSLWLASADTFSINSVSPSLCSPAGFFQDHFIDHFTRRFHEARHHVARLMGTDENVFHQGRMPR